MTALSRVVISRRERTIALRPMGEGLMAHTLQEDRGLNSPKELFDGMAEIKTDPEMVQLATQLVQRQAGKYESADLELGSRLRALIDAKLKGEGIDSEADVPATTTSNVVDPMAALKKSLGQSPAEAQPKRKPAAQRAGKARDQAATRASRKRA